MDNVQNYDTNSYTNVPSLQTYSSDEKIWTLEERSDTKLEILQYMVLHNSSLPQILI
jgi:hypothetical protein